MEVMAEEEERESRACSCRPFGLHARERMSPANSLERRVWKPLTEVEKSVLQTPVEAAPKIWEGLWEAELRWREVNFVVLPARCEILTVTDWILWKQT